MAAGITIYFPDGPHTFITGQTSYGWGANDGTVTDIVTFEEASPDCVVRFSDGTESRINGFPYVYISETEYEQPELNMNMESQNDGEGEPKGSS